MHALPRDIANYQGKYDGGFAPIREAGLKRLKELDLVDASTASIPKRAGF